MEVVTISTKYEVVIPPEVRKQFKLKTGQKIMFVPYNGTLRVVVVLSIKKARGVLDACKLSGYKQQYLSRLLRQRKLSRNKIGQLWPIEVSSLENYLFSSN